MVRTVGTQKESMSQEWKDWYKQRGWCAGKSAHENPCCDVERTRVAKHADRLPRKAAIVPYVPVP